MKIHRYSQIITKLEKGKKQVDIAQVKEILKVIDWTLGGDFYKTIRKMNGIGGTIEENTYNKELEE